MKSKSQTHVRTFFPFAIPLLVLSLWGCNAPADAELQLRAIVVKLNKGKITAARSKGPATPSAPTIKRYSAKERTKILGRYLRTSQPASGKIKPQRTIEVTFNTALGPIGCRLFPDEAPQTVTNFVALATGQIAWSQPGGKARSAKGKFYDGLDFHRAITGFIIQTGNPGSKPTDGPGWNLEREKGTPARWSKAGVMGMVESGGENHGSQFFITVKPSRHLAKSYTAFGECQNLQLAKRIANAPKLPPKAGAKAKIPQEPVALKTVVVKPAP